MGLLSGRGHLHSSLWVNSVPERWCLGLSLLCGGSVSGAVAAVGGVGSLCLYEE
jgi:hypothetical protein